jgi:hypothetical protein
MRFPQSREVPVLARSGVLAALLPTMIKLLPVPRVLSLIEPRKRRRDWALTVDHLAHIAKSVSSRAPRFGVGECLTRSFVLYHLLLRFAYNPVLLIGGRFFQGDLECHSWIEIEGKPLCESNNPHNNFKVLYVHTAKV